MSQFKESQETEPTYKRYRAYKENAVAVVTAFAASSAMVAMDVLNIQDPLPVDTNVLGVHIDSEQMASNLLPVEAGAAVLFGAIAINMYRASRNGK